MMCEGRLSVEGLLGMHITVVRQHAPLNTVFSFCMELLLPSVSVSVSFLIAGKKDNDWSGGGSGAGGAGSNWGDPRDPRSDPRGMDPRDPRDPRSIGAVDPRDMRPDPRDARSGMMDPREHMRSVLDPMRGDVGLRDPRDIRGMGDLRGSEVLRADPRGISGRLNGGSDAGMWGQPPQPPHHHAPHHQQSQPPGKMVGPGGVSGSGWYFQKVLHIRYINPEF